MNSRDSIATVHRWLTEPLSTDVARSIDRIAAADDVQHVSVMPDVHLAGNVCIGLAVATTIRIYPAAVGGDIGCGMAAVRFEADTALLADAARAAKVLAGLYRHVPANRHSAMTMPAALPPWLQETSLSDDRLDKLKRRDGRVQLGTMGRGNHFLEFQADQDDQLWLMVHSGSRAMGQAINAHHLACAETSACGLKYFSADAERGHAYLADVAWALRYAEQNRLAMVASVVELFGDLFGVGIDEESLIHPNHNHVQRETHCGTQFWVHRKGAQSAQPGEPGIIPGSMGTASFHVSGKGCIDSLCSSSHGAGRKMSRGEARRVITTRQLHRQMETVWFDHRRDHALRDEAPAAYKNIHAVMRAQRDLITIERELQPLLSYKGR